MSRDAIVLSDCAMPKTISSLFSFRLIEAAKRVGLTPEPLFEVLGVHAPSGEFLPVQDDRHLDVWEAIMRICRDPGFPIAYAERLEIDDYGLLGLTCKTAGTLRAALDVLAGHLGAYTDAVTLSLDGDRLLLERGAPTRLGTRVAIESTLAEVLGAARTITGLKLVPREVTFAHRAPRCIDAHKRFFGLAPRFDQDRAAIAFDAFDMRAALLRSDDGVHRYLSHELSRALENAAHARRSSPVGERAKLAIAQRLPRGSRLGDIAASLAMSERTLQRGLMEEGTSFEEVKDRARRELAEALLRDKRTTVAEVASATGFSEPAAFSKAFKRWTGESAKHRRLPPKK
jgi:AraC-like DNA-binding protein